MEYSCVRGHVNYFIAAKPLLYLSLLFSAGFVKIRSLMFVPKVVSF